MRAAVFRYLETVEHDHTAELCAFTREQSRLQADEGHREICRDRRAHHLPRVAVHTRRDVEGHHVGLVGIDGRHGRGEFAGDVAFETAAQQGVHDQTGLLVQGALPVHDDASFGSKIAIGGCRVARQRLRVYQCQHGHDKSFLRGKPCDDIAVTRIVAGAADDLPARCIGKPFSSSPDRSSPGPGHQGIARNALVLDRCSIDLAHGCDGIDFDG